MLTGYWVYVLLLENNRYYIGSTGNLAQRLHQHLSGNGSKATKRSRPREVVQVYPTTSRRDAYILESYLQYCQRRTHQWKPPTVSNTPELARMILQASEHRERMRTLWERRVYKRALLQLQMTVMENSIRMS